VFITKSNCCLQITFTTGIDNFLLCQGDFVAGNLKNNSAAWHSIADNPVIHKWIEIEEGVTLPFHKQPKSFHLPNRQLSQKYT